MLRSTPRLADAHTFLDDEYQAVVVLLGLLTADATLLGKLLYTKPSGLMHRAKTEKWADFVAAMEPLHAEGGFHNGIVERIPGDEATRWTRLHAGAAKVLDQLTLEDLAAFQRWAPRIRRFSFVLSETGSPGILRDT